MFDQQTSGEKLDRDSHLCPNVVGVIRELFLDREFLINEGVPSSAYLQRASVAVDADWQEQSRDSLEVMCRSAEPPTVGCWSTSPSLQALLSPITTTWANAHERERSKAVAKAIQNHRFA